MTIYNLNLGIGWASSGVEYSQAYRAKLFRQLGVEAKFVFMDLILHENIQHLTSNIGLEDQEVIWFYQHFTDIPVAATTYRLSDLEASVAEDCLERRQEEGAKQVRLVYPGEDTYVTAYLVDAEDDRVQRAEFVSRGKLIRKDYYNFTRVFTEYYAPLDGRAHVYQRSYYNQDGSVAYEEFLNRSGESSFRVGDRHFYNKMELVGYFMESLRLGAEDLVILDRVTGIAQPVYERVAPARLAVVIHAEHFSPDRYDSDHILWNNYYEYQFKHAQQTDYFIASTQAQVDKVKDHFRTYEGYEPTVVAIPVGSVAHLKYPGEEGRKPYSLMTASRLAKEKHIDWMVRAVAAAKAQVPELSLDIYGTGGEESSLKDLIKELNAQDYIQLKGHVKLDQVYQHYEGYLTASTSEGFGLSLLEAIASGLGMVGLDVPYGNPTFIDHGVNGYLIPYELGSASEVSIAGLTQGIIDYFNLDQGQVQARSYEIAEDFTEDKLVQTWADLIGCKYD